MWLFLAFLLVPLIEIGLFIQVGGWIGLWPTLLIVVLTAIAGTWLVRAQGRQAIDDLRHSFGQLRDPTRPLAHGAMILFSGALLLTPGFFTDAVGFALLIPAVRDVVMRQIARRVEVRRFAMGPQAQPRRPQPYAPRGRGSVVEGEWERLDDDPPAGASGWTRPPADRRPPD